MICIQQPAYDEGEREDDETLCGADKIVPQWIIWLAIGPEQMILIPCGMLALLFA